MIFEISKTFTFEAAHRLVLGYKGKCLNNHGHSGEVTITMVGSKLDSKSMLIDFEELKILKEWLMESFDHATLLYKEDPFLDYLKKEGHKVFIMENNPTSESLGAVILEKAQLLFNNEECRVKKIEVGETCTSKATIYPN